MISIIIRIYLSNTLEAIMTGDVCFFYILCIFKIETMEMSFSARILDDRFYVYPSLIIISIILVAIVIAAVAAAVYFLVYIKFRIPCSIS